MTEPIITLAWELGLGATPAGYTLIMEWASTAYGIATTQRGSPAMLSGGVCIGMVRADSDAGTSSWAVRLDG